MLKDYLTGKGFIFVEKLVDEDEAARAQMAASSNGFLGVPFTIITEDNGVKENIIGFDRGKLNSVLGIQ
jgi:glutaredoxin